MTNQRQSPDGKPRVDRDRPSPDVMAPADGQVGTASNRHTDLVSPAGVNEREPAAGGDTGAQRPAAGGLVSPSGVNEGDHGMAEDRPEAGGTVNLDDDMAHPRGDNRRTGGTWDARGGDSGSIDRAPGAGLSDRNGPSDPASRRGRRGG